MASYDRSQGRPLGTGAFQTAGGAIQDADLSAKLSRYKRTIASRYRALSSEEIERFTPTGPLLVSPKIDGEQWFLIFEDGEPWLANPRGRTIFGELPLLAEVKAFAGRVKGRTIIAGELFAATRTKGQRPRHGDLALALGGEQKAEVDRVGFMAFDLVEGGDATTPFPPENYADRLAVLERLLEGGKRAKVVPTHAIEGAAAVSSLYAELVESGKAEGLVIRPADGRTHKLKPVFTLDAVIIGYTERADEPATVRSLCLATYREDGQLQIIGSCGNMSGQQRREFFRMLEPAQVASSFRHASHSGALYRFVKPEHVIEVKVTDVVADESDGSPILRMVTAFNPETGWRAVRRMPGVSILHPVFVRVREDKEPCLADAPLAQVLDRVVVPELTVHAEALELPPATILRREAFTKTTKGQVAVRKVVVFATHKADLDPAWPAFVVHYTDYSPGRKDPLEREVRLASSLTRAQEIADQILAENIKKGWAPYAG